MTYEDYMTSSPMTDGEEIRDFFNVENKRKPLERKNGKYTHDLDGLEQYADIIAGELADMFPETDLIDIEYLFVKKLGFAFVKAKNAQKL